MNIYKQVISNVYEIINNPKKIYHSCWGKILTVEKQYGNVVVYFETNPTGDQEFFSYIMAVETGKEIPYIAGKEAKYIRTLMFENEKYVLHFYTNDTK